MELLPDIDGRLVDDLAKYLFLSQDYADWQKKRNKNVSLLQGEPARSKLYERNRSMMAGKSYKNLNVMKKSG